jgi:hypothetical protein
MQRFSGRDHFFIRAIRRQKPNEALTDFRLCKEFGWTPNQLARQPAKTVQQFLVILNQIDKMTEEEIEKAKREAKRHGR